MTQAERNKLPLEEFLQWRLKQEAAAFRQAYDFTIRGEESIRAAGYTSVSHYIRETRASIEKAHQAWERANPR